MMFTLFIFIFVIQLKWIIAPDSDVFQFRIQEVQEAVINGQRIPNIYNRDGCLPICSKYEEMSSDGKSETKYKVYDSSAFIKKGEEQNIITRGPAKKEFTRVHPQHCCGCYDGFRDNEELDDFVCYYFGSWFTLNKYPRFIILGRGDEKPDGYLPVNRKLIDSTSSCVVSNQKLSLRPPEKNKLDKCKTTKLAEYKRLNGTNIEFVCGVKKTRSHDENGAPRYHFTYKLFANFAVFKDYINRDVRIYSPTNFDAEMWRRTNLVNCCHCTAQLRSTNCEYICIYGRRQQLENEYFIIGRGDNRLASWIEPRIPERSCDVGIIPKSSGNSRP